MKNILASNWRGVSVSMDRSWQSLHNYLYIKPPMGLCEPRDHSRYSHKCLWQFQTPTSQLQGLYLWLRKLLLYTSSRLLLLSCKVCFLWVVTNFTDQRWLEDIQNESKIKSFIIFNFLTNYQCEKGKKEKTRRRIRTVTPSSVFFKNFFLSR